MYICVYIVYSHCRRWPVRCAAPCLCVHKQCACVCVCVYMCTYVCTQICIYAYIYHMYICSICIYVYICVHTYTYSVYYMCNMCVCVCVYIHMLVRKYVVYVHMCTFTHIAVSGLCAVQWTSLYRCTTQICMYAFIYHMHVCSICPYVYIYAYCSRWPRVQWASLYTGWLRWVGSLKLQICFKKQIYSLLQGSFAKEAYHLGAY